MKMLGRLLAHSRGCYDDLVIVHDGPIQSTPPSEEFSRRVRVKAPSKHLGPEELSLSSPACPAPEIAKDYARLWAHSPLPNGYRWCRGRGTPGSLLALVHCFRGRVFEGPRCFQQEPHWPFAWWAARQDWILRLDADEFPSPELARWLRNFRTTPARSVAPVGFLAIWPLWDGHRSCTRHWPGDRLFLFRKSRANFWGMAEQGPVLDGKIEHLSLKLIHAPNRKSYGIRNILFRRQAYRWRKIIADSITRSARLVPRWRTKGADWPEPWRSKLRHPLLKAWACLAWFPLCQAKSMWRAEGKISISACLNPALHHFLIQIAIAKKCRELSA